MCYPVRALKDKSRVKDQKMTYGYFLDKSSQKTSLRN